MDEIRQKLMRQWKVMHEQAVTQLEERGKIYREGKVPYDKDVAHEAVRQFLDNLDDGGEFQRRLKAFMRKQGDVN
ncbi:MAG TPA: hypothetical protein VEB64_15745 [Azospirillaceae bacterium]|nr:hypothetical protein [Azospirillaceae bacterium]